LISTFRLKKKALKE